MKYLTTTIAAVMLVGCGESQQSVPVTEANPEPPTAKAPDISIHEAALKGNIEAVKQHLAAGVNVDSMQTDRNGTPLHFAAGSGHKNITELLITKGANINAKNKWGGTPMHFAARKGKSEIIELLIDKGADINTKNYNGETPLDPANRNNRTKTAALRSEYGGKSGNDLPVSNHFEAIKNDDLPRTKYLISIGDDVNAKDESGWTPLIHASNRDHNKIFSLLIAEGADINAKADDGTTPLHNAAFTGRNKFIELVINKNANINIKGKAGITPLHAAAFGGHKEIVEMLIAKYAEVNAKATESTNSSITALDLAIKNKNLEIAELLRKQGGKTGEELKAEYI